MAESKQKMDEENRKGLAYGIAAIEVRMRQKKQELESRPMAENFTTEGMYGLMVLGALAVIGLLVVFVMVVF